MAIRSQTIYLVSFMCDHVIKLNVGYSKPYRARTIAGQVCATEEAAKEYIEVLKKKDNKINRRSEYEVHIVSVDF